MRVFISYSVKDGLHYAKKLYDILKNDGHDVFLAEHDIFPSEEIWEIIPRECRERDLSIFLITPKSVMSKGQKREYILVVTKYKELMGFFQKNSNLDKVFEIYPFLEPPKGLFFDELNFAEQCKKLSTQLKKLEDREKRTIPEQVKFKGLPTLSIEGLDSIAVKGCLKALKESYQNETIIPDICNQITSNDDSDGFVDIGIHYRLPRDIFLPYEVTKQSYYNEHMFVQFGRSIAFGEQEYLEKRILETSEIKEIEVEFSPDGILKAVNEMQKTTCEPTLITTPIKYWIKMISWVNKAHIEYGGSTSRPRLNSSLVLEGYNLKILLPLGVFPKSTILMTKNALKWHVRRYPEQSALYVAFGNHQLYPERYVELLAGTACKCEITPREIKTLKFKENS